MSRIHIFLLLLSHTVCAQAADVSFTKDIQPVLAKFCVRCHGPETQEGQVRIDTLNSDFVKGPDAKKWHHLLNVLNKGEMPPEDEPQPDEKTLVRLIDWMQRELDKAIRATQKANRRVMRRLTREQYTYTLQALLGIDVNFGDALPEDGKSLSGFSNNGEVQQTTPLHLQYYQKIAREALDQAIFVEKPPVMRYRIRMGENLGKNLPREKVAGKFGGFQSRAIDPKHLVADVLDEDGQPLDVDWSKREGRYGNTLKNLGIGMRGSDNNRYVMDAKGLLLDSAVPHVERAPKSWQAASANLKMLIRRDFPARGNFVFRVTAAPVAPRNKSDDDRVPAIQVSLGNRTDDGQDAKHFGGIHNVDTKRGEFKTYEFMGRLENLPTPQVDPAEQSSLANIMVLSAWNGDFVKNKKEWGSRIQVSEVEFEAPYFPTWPPESHTQILFDSPNKNKPEVYAREVLARFMERAFRRPLRNGEVDLYFSFWKSIRSDYEHFEDSIKEVLVAVLSSPKFIYLAESGETKKSDQQRQVELASRLSYFLWNSPPDDELYELAKSGQLRSELSKQISRLINDEKSWRFVEQFADQWLKLYRHKDMQVDVGAHPAFTRFVKEDLAKETYYFLRHSMQKNLSVATLIDSDFVIINQNLAEFYGIPDVKGTEFRVVKLSADSDRGGLMTQASFLSGHSDGKQAHPIKRAVWLMERILGESPPPPPPNVPNLNPNDSKNKNLTIAQQLAVHRDSVSCRNCHQKLDPYGLVFEDYNGAGLLNRNAGKNADTNVTLPDKTTVNGVAEMKAHLLKSKMHDVTTSLVEHLLAYALGRDMTFADEKAVEAIVKKIEKRDYRMQSVFEEIALSPLFLQE